jgi:type IV conjugative transfer system coupling protein TraD
MASITDIFTQGGQTQLHKLHMIRQVMGTTIWVAVVIGIVAFAILVFWELTINDLLILLTYEWSRLAVTIGKGARLFKDVTFPFPNGRKVVTCVWVANEPGIIQFANIVWVKIGWAFTWSLSLFAASFASMSWFWISLGQKQRQPKILTGLSLVPWQALKKQLRKLGKYDVKFGKLPFPRQLETEHLLAVGTTGSGKTNALNHILSQARYAGKKAVIVDTTGGYISRFYDPSCDKILNPFDARSEYWNLWQECTEDYHFMEFAETLVPHNKYADFWIKAAQQLLATGAEKLKSEGQTSIKALLDLLLNAPLDEVAKDFEGTSVATYVDPDSGKMAHGIRATLIAALWSLRYLEVSSEYFSIKQWMQDPNEQGWLFITCQPDQRNVLRSLMTGWLSVAIKSLLAMPEDLNRRVWFVIDEIASLNYIPCLVSALEELRKYGGCMMLGMQNHGQLNKIYGQDDSHSIFDLTGTKIAMRSTGKAAEFLSHSFGQQILEEPTQSISYGAHEMRDAVSVSRQRVTRPVVSATDLTLMDNFEAYVKFPRNLPISLIKFPLCKKRSFAPAFIVKESTIIPTDELGELRTLSNELFSDRDEISE